ncbi:hypothetical protein C8R45DRAFT_1101625 [Mycena sanguinolenta]|nr:hypothetical protein C8R45DRAFT_1101625 [Mycena sanguinolenta]
MTSSHSFSRETIAGGYEVIAGWDIGICLSLFLQGVIWVQFANYAGLCKRDSMWIKFFVAGLALLTALKGLQCLCIMWIQNVVLFGDLEAASQMWHRHWVWKLSVPFEATVSFYAQMFFCRRLWLLSRSYVAVSCVAIFVFGLVSALVVRHSFAFPPGPTVTILNRLVRLTLQSAAPAALCSLMIFGVAIRVHMDFVAITVPPLLYMWSAMWTLNLHRDIRLAAENASYTVESDLRTSNSELSEPRPLDTSKTSGQDGDGEVHP